MATTTKPESTTPLPPDRAPDDAIAEPAVVATDDAGAKDSEKGSEAPVVAGVPTREDIRRQIMALLSSGDITERDVLADIHASLYHTELMLMEFRQHFESFRHSGLGRMLTRRAEKEARKHGDQE